MGRKTLLELGTIVMADTLLRWHRQLITRKFALGGSDLLDDLASLDRVGLLYEFDTLHVGFRD